MTTLASRLPFSRWCSRTTDDSYLVILPSIFFVGDRGSELVSAGFAAVASLLIALALWAGGRGGSTASSERLFRSGWTIGWIASLALVAGSLSTPLEASGPWLSGAAVVGLSLLHLAAHGRARLDPIPSCADRLSVRRVRAYLGALALLAAVAGATWILDRPASFAQIASLALALTLIFALSPRGRRIDAAGAR